MLPPDVVPYSRDEILRRESDHWVNQTSTGKLFAFGVLIATIVASAVVYQVLSNDVRDHLPEYATLKAMGHSNGYLSRVVVTQALIYSVVAYIIAMAFGLGTLRRHGSPGRDPDADDGRHPGLGAIRDGHGRHGVGRVHPQ